MVTNSVIPSNAVTPVISYTDAIINYLQNGQRLKLHAPEGGLLVICHQYHAEIVGAGAAIGGLIDLRCRQLIPIGHLYFQLMESGKERQEACAVRKNWTRCMQKVLLEVEPSKRPSIILRIIEKHCGCSAAAKVPDQVLAQLAGVLPDRAMKARQVYSSNRIRTKLQQTKASQILSA